MTTHAECPALFISAPASGQGKTSVTAAIARAHARRGLKVRVFKAGPDFIDPMVLARASGTAVYQLDLFMGGENHCRHLLHEAAQAADLVLVEGVMGLFDGSPSSADLAATLGMPVLAVIDASAMAATFGAIALGLATYRRGIRLIGVVANRVGGAEHGRMLSAAMPDDIPLIATIPRDAGLQLPQRHLGLVQPMEVPELDRVVDRWADAWEASSRDFAMPRVQFPKAERAGTARSLEGVRIGVARDAAFSFIYHANLDVLASLGAELSFFSPLADRTLPDVDALWLPGGYPELYASALCANTGMQSAVRRHVAAGHPVLAECGGMLYLLDRLTDVEGVRYEMVGALPGEATMQRRFTALGLQAVDTVDGELRGHSFHYSSLSTAMQPCARGRNPNGGSTAEAIYRDRRVTASYIHHYFASNVAATAAFFDPKGAHPL